MIIDGKQIAQQLLEQLKKQPKPGSTGSPQGKFFGAVLVGDDPASINFLQQKEKAAQELGIEFRLYKLSETLTTDELRKEIGRLAVPKKCGGFIVQLPFPKHINKHYVLNAVPKEKDVDVLSEAALGAFYTSRHIIVPPSVATVEEIFKLNHSDLRELKVVMIGAGFLIGKPVGFWLQNKVGELAVLDQKVKNLPERLRDADIVISGTGHAHLFSASDLKKNCLVIDFGFSKIDNKIAGDFDPSNVNGQLSNVSYTPTPGGTGPILVAKLFENFYTLNSRS